MALTINSNASALGTAYRLDRATFALKTSFDRLASGLRINQAKDDVAGFSISTRMESKIREHNKAIQNVGDAISMTQIADSGLQEGAQAMQRMWELAVQASNDTYNETDRQSLNDEFSQLKKQLEFLAMHTEYNGIKVLDAEMIGKKIQVGDEINIGGTLEWLSVDNTEAKLPPNEAVYSTWWSEAGDEPQLLTQEQAEAALGAISGAINTIASQRTRIGAFESRLHAIQDNLLHASVEVSSARSKIRDADMAQESAAMVRNTITQNASVAVLAQANQQPKMAMQLFG
ncbi:MAG: flagellin FliC [Magnetococcales bacterium]|nr:flagellin FliC [Magnetococcales bacterium]